MQRVRQIIVQHWQAKLLSLVVATAVWLSITSTEQRAGLFPGTIPVDVVNVPNGLTAIVDDDNVKVTLLAEHTLWQRLTIQDLLAEVSAAGLEEGVAELPVYVTSRVPGVEVIRTDPATILVRLEPIIEKSVPITLSVNGQAAEGFASGVPVASPDRAVLRGPASQLNQIDEAIGSITLNGDRRDVSTDVPIAVLVAGEEPSGVILNPARVTATVPVARAGNVKTVGVVLSTEGALPNNVAITEVQLTPSVLSVTGPPVRLAELSSLTTLPIRLSDITGSTEVRTTLVLPDGVLPLDATSVEVVVRFVVTPTPLSPPTVDNAPVTP